MSRMVTLAAIQQPPVFLNLAESVKAAIHHIEEAANAGAQIVGFAECWLPGYPLWFDFAERAGLWGEPGTKQLYRLLSENCITSGDPHLAALQDCADRTGVIIMMGAQERDRGTLYNTSYYFKPGGGAPLPHRKLVPTYTERLVWGRGDGSMLHTLESEFGTVGALICWEHWMPLARAAMHAKAEAVHIAQWPAAPDIHQLASRHYAFEGRCAVIAAASIITKGDIIDGFESLGADAPAARDLLASIPGDNDTLVHNGGSAIIAADARYVAGPVYHEPGSVMAAIDLDENAEGRLTLDTAGHYSRPDIFDLRVNTQAQPGVRFEPL